MLTLIDYINLPPARIFYSGGLSKGVALCLHFFFPHMSSPLEQAVDRAEERLQKAQDMVDYARARLERAEARLEKAEARLEKAQSEFKDWKEGKDLREGLTVEHLTQAVALANETMIAALVAQKAAHETMKAALAATQLRKQQHFTGFIDTLNSLFSYSLPSVKPLSYYKDPLVCPPSHVPESFVSYCSSKELSKQQEHTIKRRGNRMSNYPLE